MGRRLREPGWLHRLAAPVLFLTGLLAWFPRACTAAPPEHTRLRALLVIDTNSNLRDSTRIDQRTMVHLLQGTIPRDRREITILAGNDVTPDKILNYYKRLRTGPSEALLFYYAGHGATDKAYGHYLALQAPRRKDLVLTRTALRQAMQGKGAGLVVILTDCCSDFVPLAKRRPATLPPSAPREIHPVVRCLLFRQRGVVDITASTNEPSWGDSHGGGIFTRTLARLMEGRLRDLDTDRDGFVTWKEFFPILKSRTQATFGKWSVAQRARGEVIRQKTQMPRMFRLLPDAPLGRYRAFAVVSLTNRTGTTVHYQYRWAGAETWHEESLTAGQATTLFCPLSKPSGPLPALEVQELPDTTIHRLEARRWEGSGTPGFAAGMRYSFRD